MSNTWLEESGSSSPTGTGRSQSLGPPPSTGAELDRLLLAAGALAEPALRALDAIHVAAAAGLSPLDAFVTYDERQAAAARLAGIRTVTPGS